MAGPYAVIFSHAAARRFAKLTRDVQARLTPKIDALATDPRPSGCEKLEGVSDAYRIRAGDYRVVYYVDDGANTVTIARVAHRRDVYRGL